MKVLIIGIYVNKDIEDKNIVQNILSKYGCSIRTRLGLNVSEDLEDSDGIIILELLDGEDARNLVIKLKNVKGIKVDTMDFK